MNARFGGLAPALSRRQFTLAGLAAAGLGLTGCGGSAASGKPSGTLRLGQFWPPLSLDPAKIGGESTLYIEPAYDPLIYRAPDGSYQPRLATSWRYLGAGNTAFELTLRPGVTFSDGAQLTADAVKANIAHYQKAGGQAAAFLATITGVTTVDAHTVQIRLSAPNPDLPAVFSQDYFAGNMISPAALAQPSKLATQSYGAGPYMLAPSQTVSGSHYTYIRNPKYWNPPSIHYDKLVLSVIPNENTGLDALKTGQVDVISAGYDIATSARSAGLRLAASPAIVAGIQLNDRAGALCQPLGDQRVRQALNYAVDRDKITKALLGQYGIPTDQLAAPGGDGYNPSPYYTHDVGKARQLLAAAGCGNGFTLPVVIPSTPAFPANLVQAVAADLGQIGVSVKISAVNAAASATELTKYPASIMGWGVLPVYFMGRGLWLADAIGMNPFHSTDPTLENLDRQAAAADPATRARLDRQIVQRVVELAWFLPVCLEPIFLISRETVTIGARPNQPLPGLNDWRPAA